MPVMRNDATSQTSVRDTEPMLDAARRLYPLVREHAEAGERDRRIARPVTEALLDAGLFHMSVPRAFGGRELTPKEMVLCIEELARGDASTGWCVGKATCSALVARSLPEPVLHEMFDDRKSIGACVLASKGQAIAVPGGIRMTGRWSYATTSQDCTWIALGTLVSDGDQLRKLPNGQPVRHLAILNRNEFQVCDTWHVSGLAGSGSQDVEVTAQFIPEARVVGLFSQRTLHTPLYGFPIFALLRVLDAAAALGVGRRAIEEFADLAKQKASAWGGNLRDQASAQQFVGQAEGMVRSGRAFLLEAVGDAWAATQGATSIDVEHRVMMTLAATEAVSRVTAAVSLMYREGGVTSMMTEHTMQRLFRDIHAITQDVAVHHKNYEYAGKHVLGVLDVETAMRL
jgi:alkylation response protein AidB-like acyl-CoA dehydrogenase